MKNKLSTTCKACGQKTYVDKIYLGDSVYVRSEGGSLVLFLDDKVDKIIIDKGLIKIGKTQMSKNNITGATK